MSRLADQHVGKLLVGLFVFAAVVIATAVFFLASRPDDAWVGPQAEKAQQESLKQMKAKPANK